MCQKTKHKTRDENGATQTVLTMHALTRDVERAMEEGRKLGQAGHKLTFAVHGDCPMVSWQEKLHVSAWTELRMAFPTFAELVAFAHGYRQAAVGAGTAAPDKLSMWRETGCTVTCANMSQIATAPEVDVTVEWK